MEPHTQEIIFQLQKMNQGMNKMQNQMNEMEKRMKILNQSTNIHSLSNADNEQTIRRYRRDIGSTMEEEMFSEEVNLRPSRMILDDLQMLNESFSFKHPYVTIAYYQTQFKIINKVSDLKNVWNFQPSNLSNRKTITLPYLLTEEPVIVPNGVSTKLMINDHPWLEKTHAYYITSDGAIQRVLTIISTQTSPKSPYLTEVLLDPLSIMFDDFLTQAKEKSITVLGLENDTNSLYKDGSETTIRNILLRSLLYIKARDYLLDNQAQEEKEDKVSELEKHLTRLQQSTVSINGIHISTNSYEVSLKEMTLMEGDVGDDDFALMCKWIFAETTAYVSGNRFNANKVATVLKNQYQNSQISIPVEMTSAFDSVDKNLVAFGVIVNEINASVGQNLYSMPGDLAPSTIIDYSEILSTSLSPVPFEGQRILVEIRNEKGEIEKYYDTDFHRSSASANFEANRQGDATVRITDMTLSAAAYHFPKGTINRFIDLFFLYPQMLPYSAQLTTDYAITMVQTLTRRADDIAYVPLVRALTDRAELTGNLKNITVSLGDGLTVPALRLRIRLDSNTEDTFAIRRHHYQNIYPKDLAKLNKDLMDNFLRQTTLVAYDWVFYLKDGQPWDRDVEMHASFAGKEKLIVPILSIPEGFSAWTTSYDLEFIEMVSIINALIFRSSYTQMEISTIKTALSDVTTLVNHLVTAVNGLEKAFTDLTNQLQKSQDVPWWKKALQGLVMVAGIAGTLVFPFSLPIAIALIAGSTAIQVGLMFADGDYITGGVQLAGTLIAIGTGYYSFRKANSASYPVTNLKEAKALPIDPALPGASEVINDGLWIEVKPLKMLGPTVEGIGEALITSNKSVLRTLFKFENAPVHARVRSITTKEVEGRVFRSTVVTGVTDGMPYLSHINPRPGTYEMLEVYQNDGFVNGWEATNVPTGGTFDELPKSVQGLLIEGVGTDEEFKSLINTWKNMANDERAIALNDAQDYIRRTQTEYTELANSRVPLSFDDTLVKKVSNVFAKHAGIYELTGVTNPSGPNNCQTYAKEIRDFFAKGALRRNKMDNSSFRNDLMDAFDTSTQFSHVYKPAFIKRSDGIDRTLIPPPIA